MANSKVHPFKVKVLSSSTLQHCIKTMSLSVIILFLHCNGHSHTGRSSVWKKIILSVKDDGDDLGHRSELKVMEAPLKVFLAHSFWLPGVQIGYENLATTRYIFSLKKRFKFYQL